jgi:hypothetical protein
MPEEISLDAVEIAPGFEGAMLVHPVKRQRSGPRAA